VGKRILVVDDSPIALELARRVLVEAAYVVETRASPEDLAARGADGFDLILMDVAMPEMFGDDVAVALRARGVTTPIYLLSSLHEDELRERARDAGVDGYITKRAGIRTVVEQVKRILGA
jgi:two-component system response regulator MprA